MKNLKGTVTEKEGYLYEVTVDGETFDIFETGEVKEANTPQEPSFENTIKPGEIVTAEQGNTEYRNNGTAIIPVGFSIVPGLDDISQGLVISDDVNDKEIEGEAIIANGNQFVWVPVNFNEFKRQAGYANGILQAGQFVSNERQTGKYYEPAGDGITVNEEAEGTEKEAQEMYKSVKENGGFYIGRYEAGITETTESMTRGKMVCKKGVKAYNAIQWGKSMDDETEGAVALARAFAGKQNYTSVKSTLCYGVQWDAIMNWMSDIKNSSEEIKDEKRKYYIIDSIDMGWLINNYNEGNPEHKTGIDVGNGKNNESNKVKNIYDMAGNVFEWTMEADGTDKRVHRGGHYENDSYWPASSRYGSPTTRCDAYSGFRPALYLK